MINLHPKIGKALYVCICIMFCVLSKYPSALSATLAQRIAMAFTSDRSSRSTFILPLSYAHAHTHTYITTHTRSLKPSLFVYALLLPHSLFCTFGPGHFWFVAFFLYILSLCIFPLAMHRVLYIMYLYINSYMYRMCMATAKKNM